MKLHELKEQREALGYQIERVADLMKIRPSAIRSIESSDNSEALSQLDIFCIRRYCDILEVDFNTIEFDKPTQTVVQPAVTPYPVRSSGKIIIMTSALCLMLILILVFYYQTPNLQSATNPEAIIAETSAII